MSRVWISDMTHTCVWHDSRVTWLTRDMNHLECVSWIVDISHWWISYVFLFFTCQLIRQANKIKENMKHSSMFMCLTGICEIWIMTKKWHKSSNSIVSHVRIRCFFLFLAGKLATHASKTKRKIKHLSLLMNNYIACRHQSLMCVTRLTQKVWCVCSEWHCVHITGKSKPESTRWFVVMRRNSTPNTSHMFLHSSGGFDCLEKNRVSSIVLLNKSRIWLLGIDTSLIQQLCRFFRFLLCFDLLYQSRAIGVQRSCNLLLNKDKTSAFSSRFFSSTQSFHVLWRSRVRDVGIAT